MINSRIDMIFISFSDSSFGFGVWCTIAVAVVITIVVIVKGMQYRKRNTRGKLNLTEFDIINNEAS